MNQGKLCNYARPNETIRTIISMIRVSQKAYLAQKDDDYQDLIGSLRMASRMTDSCILSDSASEDILKIKEYINRFLALVCNA